MRGSPSPGIVVDGPDRGRPLVLSNSLGTRVAMWDRLLPALAGDLRLVRYDLRGHGRPSVPPGPYSITQLGGDLLRVLDRAGLDRADLCGVSIGAMASVWVAAYAPERVDRLILCCTSALPGMPQVWIERAATVRAEGMAAVADVVVGRWFPATWAAHHPEVVADLRAALVAIPAEGYAGACEALVDLDLRPILPRISAPTMIVAGGQDPAFPPSHARLLADGIRGSRLALIASAAHLANVQCPDEVAALILDHLGVAPRALLDA